MMKTQVKPMLALAVGVLIHTASSMVVGDLKKGNILILENPEGLGMPKNKTIAKNSRLRIISTEPMVQFVVDSAEFTINTRKEFKKFIMACCVRESAATAADNKKTPEPPKPAKADAFPEFVKGNKFKLKTLEGLSPSNANIKLGEKGARISITKRKKTIVNFEVEGEVCNIPRWERCENLRPCCVRIPPPPPAFGRAASYPGACKQTCSSTPARAGRERANSQPAQTKSPGLETTKLQAMQYCCLPKENQTVCVNRAVYVRKKTQAGTQNTSKRFPNYLCETCKPTAISIFKVKKMREKILAMTYNKIEYASDAETNYDVVPMEDKRICLRFSKGHVCAKPAKYALKDDTCKWRLPKCLCSKCMGELDEKLNQLLKENEQSYRGVDVETLKRMKYQEIQYTGKIKQCTYCQERPYSERNNFKVSSDAELPQYLCNRGGCKEKAMAAYVGNVSSQEGKKLMSQAELMMNCYTGITLKRRRLCAIDREHRDALAAMRA